MKQKLWTIDKSILFVAAYVVRSTIIVCSVIGLVSCGDEAHTMAIPEKKMIKVLSEVHVAEASSRALPSEDRDSIRKLMLNEVYKSNGVTVEQFDETMDYLSFHQEAFEALYDSVAVFLARESK